MKHYKIDQYFEYTFNCQRFDTGAATDADALPTYRVYEENNDTVIASGDTAKRDDANTTGYYYVRGQCTTALGYEVGKCYEVRVAGTVNSVAGAAVVGRFAILPAAVWDSLYGGTDYLPVDAVQVEGADATDTIGDAVLNEAMSGHTSAGTLGAFVTNLHDEATGKWVLDPAGPTLTLYRADGVTILKAFNLGAAAGAVPAYVSRTPA